MPLTPEQRQKVQSRISELQQGGQPQAQEPPATGGLPPDIAKIAAGVPSASPYIASATSSGPRINYPKSREAINQELALTDAKAKLTAQNRPASLFKEKTGFQFKSVGRILDKLEKRSPQVQDVERGIRARVGGVGRTLKARAGYDKSVTTYSGLRKAILGQMAKTVSGEGGRLTDQDIARVAGAVPEVTTTREEARDQFGVMREIVTEVMEEAVNRGRKEKGLDSIKGQIKRSEELPKLGGKRMRDKMGREATVYPDGTYELVK